MPFFECIHTSTLVPRTSTHNVSCIRETQSPAAASPFPKKCKLFCAPFQSAIVTQRTLCKCTVNTVQHRIQNIMIEVHIALGTYTVHSLFKWLLFQMRLQYHQHGIHVAAFWRYPSCSFVYSVKCYTSLHCTCAKFTFAFEWNEMCSKNIFFHSKKKLRSATKLSNKHTTHLIGYHISFQRSVSINNDWRDIFKLLQCCIAIFVFTYILDVIKSQDKHWLVYDVIDIWTPNTIGRISRDMYV